MTGLSRAQITRLVKLYSAGERVKPKSYRRHRFASRYSRADIELLASVDEAHETLSGPATQKIRQREFHEFGQQQYERLSQISVAHLYRLRKSRAYRERRVVYQPTRPTTVSIGERRAPQPEGRPGYIRVDTVHQGDLDGVKGLYHINAVDEVTQWQVVGATAYISEAWLIPVLEAMLTQFRFRIRGFHSDNGSEFINHTVAGLLNKHRPCSVPERVMNAKGKEKRVYRWYATPWEILRQLPGIAGYLKPEITSESLEPVHAPTAIRKQHGRCSKQNGSYSRTCARRELHERRLWK